MSFDWLKINLKSIKIDFQMVAILKMKFYVFTNFLSKC